MYSTALVFEETFAQTAFALLSCAVPGLSEFYSPVATISQPWGCAIPGAHLGSTARIQRDIRADVFAVVNCAVVGLSVFYSLVLRCSLVFFISWF